MRPLRSCPVCGGTDLRPFSMDAWHPGRLHFAQARCHDCGLVAAQPQATEEELTTYYATAFYEEQSTSGEDHWRGNVRDYPHYELPLMERLWAGFAPPPGASFAEIGCGYGALLTLLKERGYAVRGVEVSASATAFCRSKGLDVRQGKDFGEERAAYDAAASFQVIEHVTDPRAFVRGLVQLVKPGGVVVITTENIWTAEYVAERLQAQLRGRTPPFRSPSEHTFLFEAPHLERLLREEGCSEARATPYERIPPTGSLHFRLYREAFRTIDRLLGGGAYLMAVGRRAQ